MRTLLVTLTFPDATRWPEVAEAGAKLDAGTASLQGEGPSLVSQLDALVQAGVAAVHLIGVTFGDDAAPVSWLGRVARWWLESRGPLLDLWFEPRALHGIPVTLPGHESARRLVPKDSLTNPEWAKVPDVARHVLICRGPRCNAKGAAATHAALSAELARNGAADSEVLLSQSGCVYPCNQAPVIVVQPDMAWIGPVGPKDVPGLVAELLTPSPLDLQVRGLDVTRPCRREDS
ncbi:MAG: (2Fe-2S) ferredoxin domain-containing protein [Propionibacteriaceae bacterium]|nr:(2Fe-2S) ferredoxin domain-containing protein [Propionibacteriaceae bacterium]